MIFVDTHTHIYLPEEFPDSAQAVERALAAGVGHMVFPNVDLATVEPMIALHERYPDVTSVAVGLHPTEVKDDYQQALSRMEQILASSRVSPVAVGEIGIDLYWDSTYREEQRDAFEQQCRWAVGRGLPVIIHCREGLDDTLEVLSGMSAMPRGVFHSFGGNCEDVDRIRAVGDFYFGINGIVTFKNSKLRDVLPHIGLDRILLETDSPYLAPVPNRGKRNESSYIPYIAHTVADAVGETPEDVAMATTANARRLFGLGI